jgi:hypothetical protein
MMVAQISRDTAPTLSTQSVRPIVCVQLSMTKPPPPHLVNQQAASHPPSCHLSSISNHPIAAAGIDALYPLVRAGRCGGSIEDPGTG